MKKICLLFMGLFMFLLSIVPTFATNNVETSILELLNNHKKFIGKKVTVTGNYTGWKNAPSAPPVSRSDWVICDDKNKAIYCTGKIPQDPATSEPPKYGNKITLLAEVYFSEETNMPFLRVLEIMPTKKSIEKMVSIMQVLFNAPERLGDRVSVTGVLAKGYGVKGDRQYLLADPSGVIKLGRLPKLYPKGTIMHVSGVINEDDDGLPFLDEIKIVSAQVE